MKLNVGWLFSLVLGSIIKRDSNASWLTYGGNPHHTGYVNYSKQITSNIEYKEIFYVNTTGTYSPSSIAGLNNIIYFNCYSSNNGENILYAYDINGKDIIWAHVLSNPNIGCDYCSAPSISVCTFLYLIYFIKTILSER